MPKTFCNYKSTCLSKNHLVIFVVVPKTIASSSPQKWKNYDGLERSLHMSELICCKNSHFCKLKTYGKLNQLVCKNFMPSKTLGWNQSWSQYCLFVWLGVRALSKTIASSLPQKWKNYDGMLITHVGISEGIFSLVKY